MGLGSFCATPDSGFARGSSAPGRFPAATAELSELPESIGRALDSARIVIERGLAVTQYEIN
jgi:hypothetical protein